MRLRYSAALMLFSLLTVFGCGDGDSGKSSNSSNNSTSNIATKPASRVLAESAAALAKVKSVHLEGAQAFGSKRTDLSADLQEPDRIRLNLDQRKSSVALVVTGGSVYIRANEAFWREQKTTPGKLLANRWLKVPGSTSELESLAKELDVRELSRCLVKGHGKLTLGGKAEVDGKQAVVIVDKGDKPGSAPGKLFVAATGEPLPLRALVTGKQRPGGVRDPVCNDPDSPSQRGDEITFSRYNEDLNIDAPKDALDLESETPANPPNA